MVKLFQRRIKRAKKEKRELVAWILWNALKPAIIKAEILGDWLYYIVHRKAENSCLLALYTFIFQDYWGIEEATNERKTVKNIHFVDFIFTFDPCGGICNLFI